MLLTVADPVLLTSNVQAIWSPGSVRPSALLSIAVAVLASPSLLTATVTVDRGALTVPPPGASPVAVAVFVSFPASTSACVMV